MLSFVITKRSQHAMAKIDLQWTSSLNNFCYVSDFPYRIYVQYVAKDDSHFYVLSLLTS